MGDHRRSVAEMFADWLREASLLVAVFGWLDKAVKDEPFDGRWAWEVLGVAAGLFVAGAALEQLRSAK